MSIARILLANGFIPNELSIKMLLPSSTPHEKATILVTCISELIKVTPKRFHDFMSVLSEQSWTKDMDILQSAYKRKSNDRNDIMTVV